MNQAMEETVLGVVPHMKLKTGLFSSKEFTLVVTNQRVIFASLSKEMVKQAHQEAVEKSKAENKGYWERSMMGYAAVNQISAAYESMHPEEIIGEHPDNFFVPGQYIKKVTFKLGDNRMGESSNRGTDTMVITTHSEKLKLTTHGLNVKDVKDLFYRAAIYI